MKYTRLGALLLILAPLTLLLEGSLSQASGEEPGAADIRNPILAGTWYPGNPDALKRMIRGLLSEATVEPPKGQLKALIVPHAGYRFSGHVAAHAYKLIESMPFRRVVLVGPSHRLSFRGVSVGLQSAYKTPLGLVPVDQSFAKSLLKAGAHVRWVPQAHSREHSLEIQLPFLQMVLKNFQIVPILMGDQDFGASSRLAEDLVRVMGDSEGSLLLASTDLSHFHSYERAKALDGRFMKLLQDLDPEGLAGSLASGSCEACGKGPALAVMLAAQKLAVNRAVILKYANSGDVTGDHKEVVGYLSAALIKGE